MFKQHWALGALVAAPVACFIAGLTGYVMRDLRGKWGLRVTLRERSLVLDLPAGRSLIRRPPPYHAEIPYAEIEALESRLEAYRSLGMALMQIDFDLTSIAALLTILGYSLNDTIVIYDRIREMLRRYKRMSMPELLNISVNATLSRSIITHVTVTLALLALLLFGGSAIHSFTATMMFGAALVGTYTSVFIAAPILIYLGVGTGRVETAEEPAPVRP